MFVANWNCEMHSVVDMANVQYHHVVKNNRPA